MLLPAIHTIATAPARHLLACEQVARDELWHEHPALRLLQHWQITGRWLMARFVLAPEQFDRGMDDRRHGIARRMCAEICTELEVEDRVLEPHLVGSRTWTGSRSSSSRRQVLRRMIERVMDVAPGTSLFDARVLALGKAFDRHLLQTISQVAALRHRAEWATLGRRMADKRRALVAQLSAPPQPARIFPGLMVDGRERNLAAPLGARRQAQRSLAL